MKHVYAILNWTFGILFLLAGIGNLLSNQLTASLILISMSLIVLPPVNKFILLKTGYEISPKVKLILFIALVIALSVINKGEQRLTNLGENEKLANQQAEQKKEREEQIRYGKVPFDTNITMIPKEFYGPRFSNIYNELKSIKKQRHKQEVKGEFETTKQYSERIISFRSQRFHIIDGLYSDSIIGTSFPLLNKYNADKQEMVVQINIESQEYIEFGHHKEDSYIGENAFGVERRIQVISESNYFLVFSNIKKDIEKNIIFKMLPDEAREKKGCFKGIALLKLQPPYVESDIINYRSPTIYVPKELTETKHLIMAELLEVWIYNNKTGEIIQKIKYK